MRFKAIKTIFWFRFFAVIDVLFAEQFQLTTWDKEGRQTAHTQFSKSEIKNNL